MERELEVQIGMKQEMEMSMKMLEKDVCEKQDALMELRQQLDDLRTINQQLSHKSQVGFRPAAEGERGYHGYRRGSCRWHLLQQHRLLIFGFHANMCCSGGG